jgi:hypothetical protein
MKKNKVLLQKVLTLLSGLRLAPFRLVFAEGEEPGAEPGVTPAPAPTPTINYETLIAEARKQEKDKLYPQIEKLKAEKEALVQKNNALLIESGEKDLKIRDLEKQLADAVKGKADPEEIKTLKETIKAKEAEVDTLKKEINSGKLEAFKKAKIAEANGQLIEDLVAGSTEEEIIASIELSKKAFQSVASKFAQVNPAQAFQVPTPVANSNSGNGASVNLGDVTLEQIQQMTPKEYGEWRKQQGLK